MLSAGTGRRCARDEDFELFLDFGQEVEDVKMRQVHILRDDTGERYIKCGGKVRDFYQSYCILQFTRSKPIEVENPSLRFAALAKDPDSHVPGGPRRDALPYGLLDPALPIH